MAFTTTLALLWASSTAPAFACTFPELAATTGHFRDHKIDAGLAKVVLFSQGDLLSEDVLAAVSAKLTARGQERWIVPSLDRDLPPVLATPGERRTPRQRADNFLERWQKARETETNQPEVMARDLKLALATELVEGLLDAYALDRPKDGWYSESPKGREMAHSAKGQEAINEFRAVVDDIRGLFHERPGDSKLPRYKQLRNLLDDQQTLIAHISTGIDGSLVLSVYGFGEKGDLQFFEYGRRGVQWPRGDSWTELAREAKPLEIGSIRERLEAGEPAALIGVEAAIHSFYGDQPYVACMGDELAFMVDMAIEDGKVFPQRLAPALDRTRYLRKGMVSKPAGLRSTPLVQADREILGAWQKKAVAGQTSPWMAIDAIYSALPTAGKHYAFVYYHRSGRMFSEAGLPFPRIEAGAPSAACLGFLSALKSDGLTARLDDGHAFRVPLSGRLVSEAMTWYGMVGMSMPGMTLDQVPSRTTFKDLIVEGRPTQDVRLTIYEPDKEPLEDQVIRRVDELYREVASATPERWRAAKFRLVTTRVDDIRIYRAGQEFLTTEVPHAPQPGPLLDFDKLPQEWRDALTHGG